MDDELMAIPFQQAVLSHDRAPDGRLAPVTPWPLPWPAIGPRFGLCHIKLAGLPTPGRTARELTTERRRFRGRGHLLIRNIDHGHNRALDLLRRAAR